ncbi:hypothetical protein TRAPUB_13047 [Trametes pubescens]|uniref:Uncharacterized protein n=1 Tax=Trametes pubescens TaxID=154538 RepID=A0A1M2VSA9_TRAPU|nr:hypothetical protein TRAPUB_13047 [Trametes pubescens]
MSDQWPNTQYTHPARPKYDGSRHHFTADELLQTLDGVSVASKWKPCVTRNVPDPTPEQLQEMAQEQEERRQWEERRLQRDGPRPPPEKEEVKDVDAETAEQKEEPIKQWIEAHQSAANPNGTHSLLKWLEDLCQLGDERSKSAASIVLGIALARQDNRRAAPEAGGVSVTPPDTVELIWALIFYGLRSGTLGMSPNRTAQGFLAIPLCSRSHHGDLSELFRLHVWQPHEYRGKPEIAIHAHQSFARSWVLGGTGIDHQYSVAEVQKLEEATTAKFKLQWETEDTDKAGTIYQTYQRRSVIENTGTLMTHKETSVETHTKDMSYSVLSNIYHRSQIPPEELHATLFSFDAFHGYYKHAGVLGPVDVQRYSQDRDPHGITAKYLATLAESLRHFDFLMNEARKYSGDDKRDWESAQGAISDALVLFKPDGPLANAQCCLDILHAEQARIASLVESYQRPAPRKEPLPVVVASEHSEWPLEAKGVSATAVSHKAQMLRQRKAKDAGLVDDLPEG